LTTRNAKQGKKRRDSAEEKKEEKKCIVTAMFNRKIVQTLISQSTICTKSHFILDDKIDREHRAEKVTD